MLKINLIPYIQIDEHLRIQINKNLLYRDLIVINESYGNRFVKYEGGLIIKDSNENVIFETSDFYYYFMAEAFIIRNYLTLKYNLKVTEKILILEMTSGMQLKILKIADFFRLIINKDNLKLPVNELLVTDIDYEKLLNVELTYNELLSSLEYSIEAIYNMYLLNYDFLKDDNVFLNYFDYLKKVVSKKYFSDFENCW